MDTFSSFIMSFWYFAYFFMKVYVTGVMGIHKSCLGAALLMSTKRIYFFVEKSEKCLLDIPIILSYAE